MNIRYASVCSGIEAATVAWKPLGWSCAWLSEIEKFPCAVLNHHYPDTPNLGDMTLIDKDVINDHGPIDLLVGGTPCQSFSVAGLRKGMADPRGNLALEFLRLVDAARPRWVVWENVPGVLSSGGGRDFGSFLGGLVKLGYQWAYRILDAQYFGVPQRRRRVFVVGHIGDWRRAASVLFERQSLSGHPPPSREAGPGVAALTANGVGVCGADDNQAQSGHIIGSLTARGSRNGGQANDDVDGNKLIVMAHGQASAEIVRDGSPSLSCNHEAPILAHTLRGEGFDASEDGTGRGTPIVPGVVAYRTSGNCGVMEQGDRTAALNTATDPNQNIIRQDTAARRLTPAECESLQGFPRNHTLIPYRNKPADNCPDGPRYKAIGNSMAVPVMRWIGERIELVESIGATP